MLREYFTTILNKRFLVLAFMLSFGISVVWTIYSAHRFLVERSVNTNWALDAELQQLAFLPNLLATDPRLKFSNIVETPNSDEVNRVLALWAKQATVEHIFLVDDSGTTVAASNWNQINSFIGKNYSFRPYFKEALNNGDATFFAVGATTGVPGYFIASAVANTTGQHLGVVVIKISPSNLIKRLNQVSPNWIIVDDLGVSILSNRQDWIYRVWIERPGQLKAAQKQSRYELQNPNFKHWGLNQSLALFKSGKTFLYSGVFREAFIAREPWRLIVVISTRELAQILIVRLAFTLLSALTFLMLIGLIRAERQRRRDLQEQALRIRTQLETAKQQLVRKENWAALGRMSGAIAHEINQPLASLRFDLACLDKFIDGDVEQSNKLSEQTMQEAKSTLTRIVRIIETLRLFSRQNELELVPVDVIQVTNEAIDRFKKDRPVASKCLSVKNSQRLDIRPLVMSNSVLIEQIMINLLSNAVAAASKIAPAVVLDGPYLIDNSVCLTVSDNGDTWPDTLMEQDWTMPSSTKSITGNFGLGLSLCKSFLEKSEGTMVATRNKGLTNVTIKLPLVQSA